MAGAAGPITWGERERQAERKCEKEGERGGEREKARKRGETKSQKQIGRESERRGPHCCEPFTAILQRTFTDSSVFLPLSQFTQDAEAGLLQICKHAFMFLTRLPCEHSHLQHCVLFFAGNICEHLRILCKWGLENFTCLTPRNLQSLFFGNFHFGNRISPPSTQG